VGGSIDGARRHSYVDTQSHLDVPSLQHPAQLAPRLSISGDQADAVAAVAVSRRALLLRVHRHRLRPADLEDCHSQAVLELIAYVKRGGRFKGRREIAVAIENRFLSRVHDRRRAISGRSPIQAIFEEATALDAGPERGIEVADMRADPQRLVAGKEALRAVLDRLASLSADQREVIASQVALEPPSTFRARTEWSSEKYRKVAQRARAKLRAELSVEDFVP
jgi:DNA-directed RNA polymerase specialized sigma24 family protein